MSGPCADVPTAPPQQFVVPHIHGDPAAARRLAGAYRDLADAVETAARRLSATLDPLRPRWRGGGSRSLRQPADHVAREASGVVRGLRSAADALDHYAAKLQAARHHHGFSLHKLVAVAAVVTVTATAVVVTMGAAAVAEAALAAGAAGEAAAAAGAATAATEGAAGGLLESTAGLAGVRGLLAFAVPHVVQAELAAGFAAGAEEAVDGRLDGHEIAVAATAGLVGSAGAGAAGRVVDSVRFAKTAWPFLRAVAPHAGQGAAWAGVDAGQQAADGGSVSWREVLLAGGLAGAASTRAGWAAQPASAGRREVR